MPHHRKLIPRVCRQRQAQLPAGRLAKTPKTKQARLGSHA
jgi:hypothetical protein